jgi:hypothetical protein
VPIHLSFKGVAIVCLMVGTIAAPFMVSLETGATNIGELKTFSTRQELIDFIENHISEDGYTGYYWAGNVRAQEDSLSETPAAYHEDFSTTNRSTTPACFSFSSDYLLDERTTSQPVRAKKRAGGFGWCL